MNANRLYFEIVPTFNCKTISVVDLSVYSGTPEQATLQVLLPDRDRTVEMEYIPRAVTLLNSNSLGYTRVKSFEDLEDLPDGVYTIKISICPFETNWYEKDFYRTCKIECKYNQALLKLDLTKCNTCFPKQMAEKLQTAWVYIQGAKANAENEDIETANELYKTADSILTDIITQCKTSGCSNC